MNEIIKCPKCCEKWRLTIKRDLYRCNVCRTEWRQNPEGKETGKIESDYPLEMDSPVRPLPCVRDEHGEIKKQPVKALLAKVDEELTELKEAIFRREAGLDRLDGAARGVFSVESAKTVALEAADTNTAITTMLEALGIDAEMRDEAQRRVNEKNRKRNRL